MSVLRRVDWQRLDDTARRAWLDGLRPTEPEADVSAILAAIRDRGDDALRELTRRLDGVDLEDPWVSADEWDAAAVEPALATALEDAAASIGRYHAEQRNALRQERRVRTAPGVIAWRRWQPIERVGGYVPGGRATYPSSVLMLAVPARLAGVDELIIATPPRRDGSISPAVLVAARIGGVDRILKAGGAQAIAALAFGTDSIPAVDKIFGAGNAWVTAAKRAVSGRVAIDLPAGPSECIVLADRTADAELVALDLLAQSEHGPDSVAIVVSDDPDLLDAVEAALPRLAAGLATGERALETIGRHGAAVLVADLDAGLEVINAGRGRARQPAVRRRRCAGRPASATPARSSSVRGRRSPPATTPRGRTTCCRRERRRAPGAASASSRSVAGSSCSGSRPTALDGVSETVERDRRGGGPSGARRERSRTGRPRGRRAQHRRRDRALPPARSGRPVSGRAVRRGARRSRRHPGQLGRSCRHEHARRRAAAGRGARARRLRRPSRSRVRRPRLRAAARRPSAVGSASIRAGSCPGPAPTS